MSKLTTIIGGGAVGRSTARMLVQRGDEVRLIQRHKPVGLPPAVEFRSCDVGDRKSLIEACRGSEVVIGAIGLPYFAELWQREWPPAMANMLSASEAANARFVFADNLYMYGPQNTPLTEDLPLTGYGGKPRVRTEITKLWKQAHDAGRLLAVAVRASDFYGPDAENSVVSTFGVQRLLAGKAALFPYSPDYPHDFTYVPDFARALITLAGAPADAYGQAWHVPNAPTHTLRELILMAANIAGVKPRIWVLPRWLLGVASAFDPRLRELREMRFQTDRPYRVDATKFSRRFWADATTFDAGLAATVEHYRRS